MIYVCLRAASADRADRARTSPGPGAPDPLGEGFDVPEGAEFHPGNCVQPLKGFKKAAKARGKAACGWSPLN